MKRLLAILLASLMIFTLFGCQGKKPVNPEDSSVTPEVNNQNNSQPTESIESVVINGVGEAELSLYNPNASDDTSLVAIVGYLKSKPSAETDADDAGLPDAIVLAVDFEEAIKDKLYNQPYQFISTEDIEISSLLGVGNDKYSVANVTTSNIFDRMRAQCFVLTPPPEKHKDLCDGFIIDQYNCLGDKAAQGYETVFDLCGDNWHASNWNKFNKSGKTDNVYINLYETEKDVYHLGLNLNEKVDITIDAITQKVNNKEFRNSIIFLSDINNLSSTSDFYGKDVDLNNAVFYQDALAIRLSNDCGLNLRDKAYFNESSYSYMTYGMSDAEGNWVDVIYYFPDDSYDNYINETENRIERVCGDDTYVYVNPNGESDIYIYKNGICQCKMVVESSNKNHTTYEALNVLFGFKPNN